MSSEDKIKTLFHDLGKATLRGVRRCPKCGTYNGTRGVSCKNTACDVMFKEPVEKRKGFNDACKLITGANSQLYSVRVRDKGPDFRGFVYMPNVHALDDDLDGSILVASTCQCFVENCLRSYVDKRDDSLQPCFHIQAALRCCTESIPLTIKQHVLNSLNTTAEMKQAVWMLASEAEGPLVQRVSRNMMAVKCKPNPKFPLGYLHFSFYSTRTQDKIDYKFCCGCKAYKSAKRESLAKKCIHYYACICAFAGDEILSKEFSYYIAMESDCMTNNLLSRHLLAVLTKQSDCEVQVQVLDNDTALLQAGLSLTQDGQLSQVTGLDGLREPVEVQIQTVTANGETISLSSMDAAASMLNAEPSQLIVGLKQKRTENLPDINSYLPGSSTKKQKKSAHSKSMEPLDETKTALSFEEWISSVTERINQTMHFQLSGTPPPLVFQTPNVFFECLRERISNGTKKKRLPNSTVSYKRVDTAPLGTFTKYIWHLTNIIHVKKVFDTSMVQLQIYRSFIDNKDGTYEYCNQEALINEEQDLFKSTNNKVIKPMELRTYLNVGNTSPDQEHPTPFIIEWTPDLFPISRIGELKIIFQYGHQRFGNSSNAINSNTTKENKRSVRLKCSSFNKV